MRALISVSSTLPIILMCCLLLRRTSSSDIKTRNPEECGEYGFICANSRSYFICRGNSGEDSSITKEAKSKVSPDITESDTESLLDTDNALQQKDFSGNSNYDKNLADQTTLEKRNSHPYKGNCPEGTICDENNVFYCTQADNLSKQRKERREVVYPLKAGIITNYASIHLDNGYSKINKGLNSNLEDGLDYTSVDERKARRDPQLTRDDEKNDIRYLPAKQNLNTSDVSESRYLEKGNGIQFEDSLNNNNEGSLYEEGNHPVDLTQKRLSGTQLKSETTHESQPFSCKSPGKFPHPNSCYVYYVCEYSEDGNLIPVRKMCTKRRVFDVSANGCVSPSNVTFSNIRRNRELQMDEENVFLCISEGKFPDPDNNTRYYSCNLRRDGCGFVSAIEDCECSGTFNPNESTCIPKCDDSSQSKCQSKDKEFSEKKYQSNCEPTTEDKSQPKRKDSSEDESSCEFECFREGNFPDPNNWSMYFTCDLRPDGCGFIASHHCCDKGQIFNPIVGKCVCLPKPKPKSKCEKTAKKPNNFPCFVEGKFADPDIKSDYYTCCVRPDGKGYIATRHSCPEGQIFDKARRKCACKTRFQRYKYHPLHLILEKGRIAQKRKYEKKFGVKPPNKSALNLNIQIAGKEFVPHALRNYIVEKRSNSETGRSDGENVDPKHPNENGLNLNIQIAGKEFVPHSVRNSILEKRSNLEAGRLGGRNIYRPHYKQIKQNRDEMEN